MQIIAGQLKGLKLNTFRGKSNASIIRPTASRIRGNIFNLLTNSHLGNRIKHARILDLFAGTGALGLEAMSRGAEFAVFIENNPICFQLIKRNVERAGLTSKTLLFKADATHLPRNVRLAFNLVFLDPPYYKSLSMPALESAKKKGWLDASSIIVIESEGRINLGSEYFIHDIRRYGSTWITIAKFNPADLILPCEESPRSD